MRPYLKKTLHKKRAGGVAKGVGPEFKPQYQKNKNKKKEKKKNNPVEYTRSSCHTRVVSRSCTVFRSTRSINFAY
jgi:hypothetical protein